MFKLQLISPFLNVNTSIDLHIERCLYYFGDALGLRACLYSPRRVFVYDHNTIIAHPPLHCLKSVGVLTNTCFADPLNSSSFAEFSVVSPAFLESSFDFASSALLSLASSAFLLAPVSFAPSPSLLRNVSSPQETYSS